MHLFEGMYAPHNLTDALAGLGSVWGTLFMYLVFMVMLAMIGVGAWGLLQNRHRHT